MKNIAKPGFRLATLIGIIIMTGAQLCQRTGWPPDNVDITPPSPQRYGAVSVVRRMPEGGEARIWEEVYSSAHWN